MKATFLKTALGGAITLALLGGAALTSAPASAGERQSYLGDGAPATLEQVRRRIFVAPAYGYDPYYYGPDYYAAPVAVHAAEEALQLHAGIGMTWEHPIHLNLKRAKADSIAYGTAGAHRSAVAELVGLQAP